MADTARRAFVATVVAGSVVVVALALWKLRLVLGLVVMAFIIAAAIRPGIDWLARHRVPGPAGLALHYLAFVGVIVALLALAVPRARDKVDLALSPKHKAEITRAAQHSTGIKHDVLVALRKRLDHLPKSSRLVKPATTIGVKAFEVLIGSSSPSPPPRTGSSSATRRSTSSVRCCRDRGASSSATPGV